MTAARDRVGPSAAFSQAASPRSIRGHLIDSLVGSAPTEIPLGRITHNPGNPREFLDEGYISALGANMGQVGQIQPATVMTRLAFLIAHPEHQDEVPAEAEYVVLDGHCRLAAARSAGLPTLKITVDDSSAGTPEDILAAALSANHFRKDLTYIEEARALEALIAHHGSAAAVAELLGGRLNSGWISQRRALLALPEDVQDRVDAGEIPLEIARSAGRKDPEEQRAFIEARLSERHAAQAGKSKAKRGRAAAAERRAAEASGGGAFYGVSNQGALGGEPGEFYGVRNGGAAGAEAGEFYGVSNAGAAGPGTGEFYGVSDQRAAGGEPEEFYGVRNQGEAEASGGGAFYGVRNGGAAGDGPGEFYGVRNGDGAGQGVPEPRDAVAGEDPEDEAAPGVGWVHVRTLNRMPWADGHKVADLVLAKMDEEQREVLLQRISEAGAASRPE
ncbi:ParB/RepB/Spo0J family partition protein [Streptomyces sp. H34-S4]|uniref:ParB/RepB/Spo0J family partition protein n=1 Tax=Streptomyces sp. H34-S4 TaxID=2996463 RepID=UPI0022704460|nr:ParB N-terminal domain-containing protein [Streptomyces sp. H34-S4]MCY0937358.1 ParB N-terminal domain-containing protein [Streptomyces sp. H34-S4]